LQNKKFPKNSFKVRLLICNEKLTRQFTDLGSTEAKYGEDIVFNKIFLLDYIFEKEQLIKIVISCPEDSKIEYIVECTVARVMGSKNLSYKHKILFETEESNENQFNLIIDAKNTKESKELLKLQINLSIDGFKREFMKSYNLREVFFTLNNFIDGKNYRSIYKSEEVSDNNKKNFSYEEIKIPKELICSNNLDKIMIQFYDENLTEFAYAITTLEEIKEKSIGNTENWSSSRFCRVFKNENKAEHIGIISFKLYEQKMKSFIDHLSENLDINLIIGIDFTASNGK